jgi:hypothetical protein
MTIRDRFSAEEWRTLTTAPAQLGAAIMAVDISGPAGITKETNSIGDELKALAAQGRTGLLGEVAAEIAAQMQREKSTPGEAMSTTDKGADYYRRTPADQQVRDTVAAVNAALAKAPPEDALAYKEWLYNVARRVAATSKEGGILGIGGKAIGDEEAVLLRELASELGVSE